MPEATLFRESWTHKVRISGSTRGEQVALFASPSLLLTGHRFAGRPLVRGQILRGQA